MMPRCGLVPQQSRTDEWRWTIQRKTGLRLSTGTALFGPSSKHLGRNSQDRWDCGVLKAIYTLWERRQVKSLAQQSAIETWKNSDGTTKEKWICELIQDLNSWINHRHGQLTFHLTQLLYRHGAFQEYLQHMDIKPDSMCIHCDSRVVDDAGHTLFECGVWERQRQTMAGVLDRRNTIPGTLCKENLVLLLMLQNRGCWVAIQDFTS